MLDNLRDEAGQSPFFQEDDSPQTEQESKGGLLLGMTALQRFILALMLFLMVCVLGAFCLLITERIVPTFL